MCGIAGVFEPRAAFGTVEEGIRAVRGMMSSLGHRGPDGEGIWADALGRCVLGHRRLKVIDLSDAGRQPMISANCRHVIVTNGEIYNFQDLRGCLEPNGIEWRGRTDTEVLVESISAWGEGALGRLDGMFAFADFDTETGDLLLVRDPFGEKPLYYAKFRGGGLAFASELQTLARLPGFDGEVSVDAMAELMMFQYIGSPRTIYKSACKLPPGHWLRMRPDGSLEVRRYFRFAPDGRERESRSVRDAADELEEILLRSVRRRLVADVPVGALLSGGVDSSTVCALAHRAGHRLKTFSIGFSDSSESEHHSARAYADHLGLENHQRVLTPDVTELLPRLGEILDEPNADWSCLPVYLLSKLAREQVTVALSGDGGDEMFAGYAWYFAPLEADGGVGSAPEAWRADDTYMSSLLMTGPDGIVKLFGRVPHDLRARIGRIQDEINEPGHDLVYRLRRNETENYLPGAVLAKVDRMSMQHALEVRTPFLNVELARFAARLPRRLLYDSGRGKVLLREVASRYLPREILDRPKMGFGLPGFDWGAATIRQLAQALLGEDSRLRVCLGSQRLDQFVTCHADIHQLWTLVMLESWLRHHPSTIPDRRDDRHPDA